MGTQLRALALLVATACLACSSGGSSPPASDLFTSSEWTMSDLGSWPDFGAWPDFTAPTSDWGYPPLPDSGGSGETATLIGSVTVGGAMCKDGWQASGTTLSSTACDVHLEEVRFGVGSGPEPDQYGCQVSSDGSSVETYLYEKDCDDKGITVSCNGTCGGGSEVTRGSTTVNGAACANNWAPTGANVGANKSCRAFIGQLEVGVGSGPEPDAYGCRYNAQTGDIEAYLYEKDCDDKGISLRCDWLCSDRSVVQAGEYSLDGASACQEGWQTVGPGPTSAKICVAGIEFLRMGVGSGPEPDRYGCRLDATTDDLMARLYEKGCDDKGIRVDCAYICLD